MPTNLDETELARLEALAVKASTLPFEDMAADGWGYVVVDILPTVTTHVPALVAEVRRLREKVEAWEWWEEVRLYDPWSEHPCCTACGNRSKRGKIFDCAVDEYEKIKSAAWRAVHAD